MSSEKSFEDLVEQAFTIAGPAFDELHKLIFCHLRFMGISHSDADDITQETLVALWKKRENKVDNRPILKHWALQVAHNKAIDDLRKRRGDISLSNGNDSEDAPVYQMLATLCPEELPEQYLEQKEEEQEERKRLQMVQQMVWLALDEVSDIARSCLSLRHMQGIKAKEVALLHGLSVRQIERYVKQGREEFRAAYERLTNPPTSGQPFVGNGSLENGGSNKQKSDAQADKTSQKESPDENEHPQVSHYPIVERRPKQ